MYLFSCWNFYFILSLGQFIPSGLQINQKKPLKNCKYVQHNMTSFENLVSLKGGRWNNLGQHLFRLKKDKMTEKNSLKRRFPLNIKMTYTKWTNICMCCNATTLSSSIQVQDRKRKQQRNALISPITSVH
jgi:hypothetical protein